MLSLLLILGGLLVFASFAQVLVLATDWLYKDDNSWLVVGLAIFSVLGLAIQAIITGVVSAAFLAMLPELLFLGLIVYGGSKIYETGNPVKVLWFLMRDSWNKSKLLARFGEIWKEGVWEQIKKPFLVGYNNYIENHKRSRENTGDGEITGPAATAA